MLGWGGGWGGGWAGPDFLMASFQNLSFETAGVGDGMADAWDYNWLADASVIAAYGTDPVKAREDFETEWDSNEDYLFAFDVLDITAAEYTTLHPAPKMVEDFEEFWNSNEGYLYGLGGPIVASYDVGVPQNFEDFEEEWDTNESYLYAFVGPGTDLTVATYDDGDHDSFESGWTDPYLYTFVGVGTDLTAAAYDTGAVESFEGTWTLMTTI